MPRYGKLENELKDTNSIKDSQESKFNLVESKRNHY